jgi:aryl-alcohol dehydrogenase-like predicted oxidoreductase
MRYLNVETAKKVSKIGLGTVQFGSTAWGYGNVYDQRESFAIVRRALELGVTLFDTAEIYSEGRSERLLGHALGDDRESVFIATKLFPFLPGARIVKNRAVASAGRLGVSQLDLYQVHWPNPFLSDDTIMHGLRALQETEMVDQVGVSAYSLKRWRSAENALGSRVLTNQIAYSLLNRSPERDLLPFAEATGHAVIAFSPLAQGLLSGRYTSDNLPTNFRSSDPTFNPGRLEDIGNLFATLREVGDAHAATPAQIALAWVIHQPAVAAIPGASSVEQLELNVAAAEIQLADDEYQALQAVSARLSAEVDTSPRTELNLAGVKHLARCGKLLAKTVLHDYRTRPRAQQALLEHHGHDITVG